MNGLVTSAPYCAWRMAITGRPFTGKPTISPDHFGPRSWASDVTTMTVMAETAARVARMSGVLGTRRSGAVSGSLRTSHAVAPHTAAASGSTVLRVRGRAASSTVATAKQAMPSDTPAATDA